MPHNPPNPVILAFGDSLTYGYGTRTPEAESYPARLGLLSGQPVVNAGINGETSAGGLRRIDETLARYHPGLTILCLGGNDILQGVPAATIHTHLLQLIEKIRASGSTLLLVAVPDFGLLGLHDLPLYETLARETDLPLARDILGPILSDPALKSDPIHPNDRGYRHMAEAIYEVMRKEGLLYPKRDQ